MYDKEFEKTVRDRMHQFDLVPAPDIWTGVEKALQKKKRRRILAYWLTSLLLLAGGMFYLNQSPITSPEETVEKKMRLTTEQSPKSDQKPLEAASIPPSQSIRKARKIAHTSVSRASFSDRNIENKLPESERKVFMPTKVSWNLNEAAVMAVNPYVSISLPEDSSFGNKPPIRQKRMKWQWEITAGENWIQQSSQAANQLYASAPLVSTQVIRSNTQALSISPGKFLAIGGQASYIFSPKMSLILSSQYQYFSNSRQDYTIRHHLLEQRLGIALSLGKKGAIRWENELTTRINLKNNEQVFDPSQNNYVLSPWLIKKTQWSLNTGMNKDLFEANGKMLQAGWRFFLDLQPYTTSAHPEKLYRMGLGVYLRR